MPRLRLSCALSRRWGWGTSCRTHVGFPRVDVFALSALQWRCVLISACYAVHTTSGGSDMHAGSASRQTGVETSYMLVAMYGPQAWVQITPYTIVGPVCSRVAIYRKLRNRSMQEQTSRPTAQRFVSPCYLPALPCNLGAVHHGWWWLD